MHKFLFVLTLALHSLLIGSAAQAYEFQKARQVESVQLAEVNDAYQRRASNIWVQGRGNVVKLLADDTKGARHQRFLVKVATGQTLLFAHNIDLASRISPLQVGDEIEFKGEYVYNPKGGIIHWTHHDPAGQRQSGWIKRQGQTFQ